jgi:hypothetical protein
VYATVSGASTEGASTAQPAVTVHAGQVLLSEKSEWLCRTGCTATTSMTAMTSQRRMMRRVAYATEEL